MDTTDRLIQYRIYVNDELKIQDRIYKEWFTILIVVYGVDGNKLDILIGNEWIQFFP